MHGGRLKKRLFLVGVFVVLLIIAAAGWVVRPFAAVAHALAPNGDGRQLRWRAGG
jgi:hypothetical protein